MIKTSAPAALGLGLIGLLYAGAVILTGPFGWDDGAITMAFARTIAEFGQVALTAASERVEGSSSTVFTLLLAAIYSFGPFSFEGYVMAAQMVTLSCLLLCLVLLSHVLRDQVPNPWKRWLLLILFALIPMYLTETLNGMEMTLFGLLMLGFAHLYSRQSGWAIAIAIVLLLTRFEAVIYLSMACVLHTVCVPSHRAFATRCLLGIALGFVAITTVRYSYYGDILPNTIRAKMHAPYSLPLPFAAMLADKAEGLIEAIRVNAGFIAVILAGVVLHRKPIHRDIKTWLLAGFFVFAFVTGKVWGYEGRMVLAALPLLLWLVPKAWPAGYGFTPTMAAVILSGLINAGQITKNVETIRKGIDGTVHVAVTPASYRLTGQTVNTLREKLGLNTLTFVVPDVGGLALCCDLHALRIVDIAMLTNTTLARQGYGALDSVLEVEHPDLIETHHTWSVFSGIYKLPRLRNGYTPVVFRNILFWLRNDHFEALRTDPSVEMTSVTAFSALDGLRYFKPLTPAHRAEGKVILEAAGGRIFILSPAAG